MLIYFITGPGRGKPSVCKVLGLPALNEEQAHPTMFIDTDGVHGL